MDTRPGRRAGAETLRAVAYHPAFIVAVALVQVGLGAVALLKHPFAAAVVIAALVVAAALFGFAAHRRTESYAGLYRFLESHDTVEIHDLQGRHATNTKVRKVEYLQDEVFALRDYVWASGHAKPCRVEEGPAEAVAHYERDGLTQTVILLSETRKRGEVDELKLVWEFEDTYTTTNESVSLEIVHETVEARLTVIFPQGATISGASLLAREGTERRTQIPVRTVGGEDDQRLCLDETFPEPPRGSEYTFSWNWKPGPPTA